MNADKFEAKKPELLAIIEAWSRENDILGPNEVLEITLSIKQVATVQIHVDVDAKLDKVLAMLVSDFVETHIIQKHGVSQKRIISRLHKKRIHTLGQLLRLSEERYQELYNDRYILDEALEELNHSFWIENAPQKLNLSVGLENTPIGPLEKAVLASLNLQ